MTPLRLTPKMKEVLERLYRRSKQADWVNIYTADALKKRGFVTIARGRQQTTGGQFPFNWAALTESGRKWCDRHFTKIGARAE